MKTPFIFVLLLILWLNPARSNTAFGGPTPASQPYAFSVTVSGQGPPMILIPGYSCSGDVWKETVAHLSNRYQCHVLTLPGYAGVSPITQPVLQTVRDEIIRYIRDQHLDRPILMGHSLGAFISLWVASQVPDRVGRLICVDGVPFISALANPAANADSLRKSPMYKPEAVAQYFAGMPTEGYETRMTQSMLAQVSDTTRARQIAHWSALSDRKTLGYTYVEISLTDLRNDIARIQSPTLVLGSLYMNSVDIARQALISQYAKLPHKTIVIANAKHFIMYDDPTWFFQQIDGFLQQP